MLSGNLLSADERNVVMETAAGEMVIPVRGVALIQFGDLSPDQFQQLAARKPGCQLRDGNYFEAELLGLEEGRFRFNSILFGLKVVDIGPVLALVTGSLKERSGTFAVPTPGGGLLRVNEIAVEDGVVKLLDNSFSRLSLPLDAVEEIRGGAYGR